MTSSSNVNLSIAALQNRRRTQLVIGLGVFAILALAASALLLYVPSPEPLGSVANDLEAIAPPGVARQSYPPEPEANGIQDQIMAGTTITALNLLADDSVYGALVREIEQELGERGTPTPDQEVELAAALAQKLTGLDQALSQAMLTNNPALVSTLTQSQFFQTYAVDQLPSWNWVVTPVFDTYRSASNALSDAEAVDDYEGIIRSLESIQQITGFQGYQGRIRELKNTLAAEYEARVKEQILSDMTAQDYAGVLEIAEDHQAIVASDPELQDVVQQADVALSKLRRDQSYYAALERAKADDWEAAVATLRSIPVDLRDEAVAELAETGKKIISTKQTIKALTDRPERLTDSNVEQYAREQIDDAENLAPLSVSLSNMIASLSGHLAEAAETITVNIISDNRATILIPRLGHIQPTSRKELNLRRTEYTFIVRCPKQRDIIETLDLTNRSLAEPVEIRLTCES